VIFLFFLVEGERPCHSFRKKKKMKNFSPTKSGFIRLEVNVQTPYPLCCYFSFCFKNGCVKSRSFDIEKNTTTIVMCFSVNEFSIKLLFCGWYTFQGFRLGNKSIFRSFVLFIGETDFDLKDFAENLIIAIGI
jgi:hypothetical protein